LDSGSEAGGSDREIVGRHPGKVRTNRSGRSVRTIQGIAQFTFQKDTVRTTNTLTDLEYQQVLDNLARFYNNPDTMPSFAVATAGTVSVLDRTGGGVSPTYSPTLPFNLQGGGALPVLSLLFPLSAQRAVTENWSLTPITDADNLRRLRCAYRLIVMGESMPDDENALEAIRKGRTPLQDRPPPYKPVSI
jgi:hypothetical protein